MLNFYRGEKNKTQPMYDFGCLMLYPSSMISTYITSYAKSNIDKRDLISDGFENSPHVTILYGFDLDFDFRKLNRFLKNISLPISVSVNNIDIFKCRDPDKNYDVVKMTVKTNKTLSKLHNELKKAFDIETDYSNYSPHITLAYCKSGCGKYYINNDFKLDLNASDIVYAANNKQYVYLPYSNTWCQF